MIIKPINSIMHDIIISKLIRSNRKSIALEIQSDGNLIIRAPNLTTKSYIDKLIQDKQHWITTKQRQIQERLNSTPKKQFKDNEEFYYLGNCYKLQISENTQVKFSFDNGFYISEKFKYKIKPILINWYKTEAKHYIYDCVNEIALTHNMTYKSIKITSAVKRWGSCTADRRLNFTWRLIMLPPEIIDYIVIHELSHLIELNHSVKFWNVVNKLMPDYKQKKLWLKNNSFKFNL